MKRCPSCNQSFDEEWLSFCTRDGTTLVEDASSKNDPPPTMMAPPPEVPKPEQANLSLPAAEYGAPVRPHDEQPMQTEWQPPPPPAYAQPQSQGLATASMIAGIASVVCLGPAPAIVAIVLGLVALSQIKKNPDQVGGQGFAWTGVITGGVTVLLYGIIVIFYVIIIIIAAGNH